MSNWILTFTGKRFDPLNPKNDDIDITDIAHALSNLCRFGGHSREFYSVAQHSVHVAEIVLFRTNNPHTALAALLHDASEAYLLDIPKPIKDQKAMEFYQYAETRLQNIIYERFGCLALSANHTNIWKEIIKDADLTLLHSEAHKLMPQGVEIEGYPTADDSIYTSPIIEIEPWSSKKSKSMFLDMFSRLSRTIKEQESDKYLANLNQKVLKS